MRAITQSPVLPIHADLSEMGGTKTVSFGKPVTAPCLVPVLHAATPTCIYHPFMVNGEVYKVTAISFGKPHGVVLVDDAAAVDVAKIGAALGTHALFPKGASIVFVQVIDSETIKARLWQRDEGVIEFTPQAVCAAVAASMMLQRVTSRRLKVFMGENTFLGEWDRIGDVRITGQGLQAPVKQE
ncbi:MAG: hypothetical protein FWE60_03875 [Oscillospiraceae bacterium]|nr:hypothetical protein [Oscillospiraceae bacterium]